MDIMKNILLGFTLLFSSLLLANPVETGHAKASLITNLQNSDQESFYVGVRLQMQDGWHTYWKIQEILAALLRLNGALILVS